MKTVGLFEAKQRLSELVDEASKGETVGIACRGTLKAILAPAPRGPQRPLDEVFASLRGSLSLPRGVTMKDLIEEGRRL
jgi:antitoxin (DNA-binding transcriptional repressor) of toxin-antitoxin stability system